MIGLLKRIFDIVMSIMGVLITWPLMLVIAILIKCDDGGKILFLQERMGKDGKKFNIYKFRTMIDNAENMGDGLNCYANDFRVTKIGNFLRNTSLDEIPQLFNIIKGDMSLVGPRPPVFKTFKDYPNIEEKFLIRFKVRPGVTGWAQVNGRNELSWDEKIVYDREYVEKHGTFKGLLFDIKIIFMTVIKVFQNEGAYDQEGVKNEK